MKKTEAKKTRRMMGKFERLYHGHGYFYLVTQHIETVINRKCMYHYFTITSAAAVLLGSEGDPGCIIFTLNTYQATFITYILGYDCRE